jgi:nitroreductase
MVGLHAVIGKQWPLLFIVIDDKQVSATGGTMHRRAFLKAAVSVAALSAGGEAWYAWDRGVFSVGEGPAYEPWNNWSKSAGPGTSEGPLSLLRAAILAASPHNTQPWRFRVGDSFVELYLDRRRNVGALDPYLREECIGMGCALENLMLSAAAHGYAATAALLPGKLRRIAGQLEMVARVNLEPGPREENELYHAIPLRHTNRSLYDQRKPVPLEFVKALSPLADGDPGVRLFLLTEEASRKRMVELSAAANIMVYSDPCVEVASKRWMRLKWSEVQRLRDGLTIDAFGLSPGFSAVSKLVPLPMLNRIATQTRKHGYADHMLAAPLMGLIAVRDRYDREQCLQAGRLWQRMHLFATARGVAARPCNEAVELVDYERMKGSRPNALVQLSHITGDSTWQPTFVFLMGYPTETAHASPRRSVQEVLNRR